MAAKLTTETTGQSVRVYLGRWVVADVFPERSKDKRWFRFEVLTTDMARSEKYESLSDAEQDCLSEVRRLLMEAGVDCG